MRPSDTDCGKSPGRPSKDMINIYQQYGQKSPFTKTKTQSDVEASKMLEDLLAWEPPDYIKTNFPYYFAGYSHDNHPVWIIEGGKFDIVKLVSQAPETVEAAEICLGQGLFRVLQTMFDARVGNEVPKARMILDMTGASIQKLWTPKAIAFMFKMLRSYKDAAEYGLEKAIGINGNFFEFCAVSYIVQAVVNILCPILGQLMERVELYGSNEDAWKARLQEILPYKSVNEKYGGALNSQRGHAVSMDKCS